MDVLDGLTMQEIAYKISRYEKLRLDRNRNMKTWRENHLEKAQEYGRKKSKELYWKKKGYAITESGEKIKL